MSAASRPHPRTRVLIDPNNAYARLGASPLDSTDEIAALLRRKRKDFSDQRRFRADGRFGKEEEGMTALQQIEAEIGTPRARAAYDLAHPQNELLTVQPGPRDRWLDRAHRADLVTAWLVEEMGHDAFLPSPECLALWAPRGVDPDLSEALAAFVDVGGGAPRAALVEEPGDDAPLDVAILGRRTTRPEEGAPSAARGPDEE